MPYSFYVQWEFSCVTNGEHNFHWIGLFIWILVFVSFLCLALGIYKKSAWLMLFSALTVFPMAYYLFGARNWVKLAILLPIIEVILALVFGFDQTKVRGLNRKRASFSVPTEILSVITCLPRPSNTPAKVCHSATLATKLHSYSAP